MSLSATCPACSLTLDVPPAAAGRKLRCPGCKTVFAAPGGEVLSLDDPPPAPPPRPQPANPFSFDAGGGSDDDEDDRPARRRRPSRPQPAGAAKAVGVVVGVLVAAAVGFGVRYALTNRAPATIPDSAWQAVDVPGLLRAKLPGPSSQNGADAAGVRMTMRTCQPNEDSLYAVAYSDDLPEHRRALPADTLLNDACNGSVQGVAGQGGREVSRETIALGPHPGRQLVVDVPQGNGKLISRIYLVNGRMVMLMAGGRGMSPDHPNAQKLFGSLEITAAPPAGPKAKAKPGP